VLLLTEIELRVSGTEVNQIIGTPTLISAMQQSGAAEFEQPTPPRFGLIQGSSQISDIALEREKRGTGRI